MPQLLQLQEQFADKIVTISLNVDHTDAEQEPTAELQSSVLEKLTALKMTAQNIMSSAPMDRVLKRYDIFGLPAVVVIGPDGEIAQVFEGAFSFEQDVTQLVSNLIQQADETSETSSDRKT